MNAMKDKMMSKKVQTLDLTGCDVCDSILAYLYEKRAQFEMSFNRVPKRVKLTKSMDEKLHEEVNHSLRYSKQNRTPFSSVYGMRVQVVS